MRLLPPLHSAAAQSVNTSLSQALKYTKSGHQSSIATPSAAAAALEASALRSTPAPAAAAATVKPPAAAPAFKAAPAKLPAKLPRRALAALLPARRATVAAGLRLHRPTHLVLRRHAHALRPTAWEGLHGRLQTARPRLLLEGHAARRRRPAKLRRRHGHAARWGHAAWRPAKLLLLLRS